MGVSGRRGESINLAYVWSAGGHSWTCCFTIPESISQRYYWDLSGLPHISHSVLSVEGMMSGTANKVCVKSLNKAWNWQDAWPSEAPARHRLWRQTETAAHLQTARLPFGLPIKTRWRSASTLLMQKMTSFISHYEQLLFKKAATQKPAGCSFLLLHGGICIHWRNGRRKKFPTFSEARSWWCRETAWEKEASNLFHYMSAFKGYFRNPDTRHT